MNYESDCFYRSWFIQQHDPEIEVMVAEKNLGFGRLMEVMGDEINLRMFFEDTCAFCVVRNTTEGLIPVTGRDPNVLSFSCVVDNENEDERLCLNDYADEEEYKEMPDRDVLGELSGHLLELGPESLELLDKIANYPDQFRDEELTLRMTFKTDFESKIVIRQSGGVVELMGDGERVMAFMQKNCSVCEANPYPSETIPDIISAQLETIGVTCCPILGRENLRNCS